MRLKQSVLATANLIFAVQPSNQWGLTVLDSTALTKIQSIALIAVILIAAIGGGAAYMLWNTSLPPPEDIRIGICGDLDMPTGIALWRGVTLAVEQVNAEGGVLGRNLTIVGEDDDGTTPPGDVAVATNALTKLITVDKADFIVAYGSLDTINMPYQDICAEHKKIIITTGTTSLSLTQRVLDDYERYKYFFRTLTNDTINVAGMLGDVLTVANYTGFTKVALLFQDLGNFNRQIESTLTNSLPNYGLEIVYNGLVPFTVTDFTSYFAAIEASGAEILVPIIVDQASIPFVKEWYDRQSPVVIWGLMSSMENVGFWELTEGKCDTVSFLGSPIYSEYPLTTKTLLTRQAYIERWGELPYGQSGVLAYDVVRFILPDALKRAGTTETEAVIEALETTNVEISVARRFVFSSSHDVMVGAGSVNDPAEDYMVMMMLQWQNGTQVPVKPEAIMKEAEATYKYPPWPGPWDNR